jgi:hypothetical protein
MNDFFSSPHGHFSAIQNSEEFKYEIYFDGNFV